MMIEGATLTVDEAAELGLVDKMLPAEGWWERVLEYASSFCPPGKASKAVGLIKRAVQSGWELPLQSGLALERELQQRLFTSEDATEGLAAYGEKRPAKFTGR